MKGQLQGVADEHAGGDHNSGGARKTLQMGVFGFSPLAMMTHGLFKTQERY